MLWRTSDVFFYVLFPSDFLMTVKLTLGLQKMHSVRKRGKSFKHNKSLRIHFKLINLITIVFEFGLGHWVLVISLLCSYFTQLLTKWKQKVVFLSSLFKAYDPLTGLLISNFQLVEQPKLEATTKPTRPSDSEPSLGSLFVQISLVNDNSTSKVASAEMELEISSLIEHISLTGEISFKKSIDYEEMINKVIEIIENKSTERFVLSVAFNVFVDFAVSSAGYCGGAGLPKNKPGHYRTWNYRHQR